MTHMDAFLVSVPAPLLGIFKTSPPTPKKIIQERREADLDLTDRHTGD